MAQPTPDPDRDRPFPWEHDEDPEQPGVTIRPLSHADLAALLAHIDHQPEELTTPVRDGDHRPGRTEPVVAIRVRAAVGRPGGSADAEYQRRWAAERAAWARTLPLRLAGVLTAGAGAALFAGRLADHLAVAAGLFVAAGVGWALRFRPSAETLAWRRGAAGERRTARLLQPLERHGWTVLHDLAIPGSRANIDCLAIGPAGVVVIDSKRYRGRLRLDGYGNLWHGRHLLTTSLRAARWEADQADEVLGVADIDVAAVVAVHGASVPWGGITVDGATVLPAGRVPDLLRALPVALGPERVAWLADARLVGLEVLAAHAAGDRAGSVLLAADPKRPRRPAAAGDLEPLPALP